MLGLTDTQKGALGLPYDIVELCISDLIVTTDICWMLIRTWFSLG